MKSHSTVRGRVRRYQHGWGTSEYLSVLLGLLVVWQGTNLVLALLREYHDEFTWALTIPF
jgi:uncharacterized membrane protein